VTGGPQVELGCGRHKVEGYFGVDISTLPGVDLVWDLDQHPWPIEDCHVARIVSYQTLEHIADLVAFMNDAWRICVDGAWAEFVVPFYTSPGAWGDPTHRRAFTEQTFKYFEPGFIRPWGDYGLKGYWHIVEQAANPTGNLWVVMRPIKSWHSLMAHAREARWRKRKDKMLG
jgi:hypothetical protein